MNIRQTFEHDPALAMILYILMPVAVIAVIVGIINDSNHSQKFRECYNIQSVIGHPTALFNDVCYAQDPNTGIMSPLKINENVK